MKLLLAAAPSRAGSAAAQPQERMVELLAGAASPTTPKPATRWRRRCSRILEAQRIISLDTLFQLADHLESIAKGEKLNTALVDQAGRAHRARFRLPRASLTANEKNAMGFGYWTDRHIEAERKLNLRAAIEKAGARRREAEGSRAACWRRCCAIRCWPSTTPTTRRREPRSSTPTRCSCAATISSACRARRTPGAPPRCYGTGWPSNAGGRLVGSLSTLPYALAEAEQNFLIPAQTQALIWGDLVPQMILSAKIPRWWNVTPRSSTGWGCICATAANCWRKRPSMPDLRAQVVDALALFAAPARTSAGERVCWKQGDVKEAARPRDALGAVLGGARPGAQAPRR